MKTSELKHPDQPIGFDEHGVVRFKKNAIVDFLVKDMRPGYDMNTIVTMYNAGAFSYEDLLQFYQLIGYSVSGMGDLSNVKDEDWARADRERQMLTDPKFVIYFRDTQSFNKGDGFQVDLKDATRYELRSKAEAMLNDVLDGGEVLTELEARAVPQ